MSANQSALAASGGVRPVGLINGTSSAAITTGTGALNSATGIPGSQAALTTSGAVTANVLTTVLSLSGRGVISFFAIGSADTTGRTHRAKITLDGVVIYDATSTNITAVNSWIVPIGSVVPSATLSCAVIPDVLQFNTSLLIEYAGNASETAKALFATRYFARA